MGDVNQRMSGASDNTLGLFVTRTNSLKLNMLSWQISAELFKPKLQLSLPEVTAARSEEKETARACFSRLKNMSNVALIRGLF